MTPEGKIKKKVKEWLEEIGAAYFMPVQTGYGKKNLDFLCCIKGRFVAIETKAPGKGMTPLQELHAETWAQAGGMCWLISDDFELEHCKEYVNNMPREDKNINDRCMWCGSDEHDSDDCPVLR